MDKHYNDWIYIWAELNGKTKGFYDLIGKGNIIGTKYAERFYIPLIFWFNKNPGLALPLVALQHHDVKINIELNTNYESKIISFDLRLTNYGIRARFKSNSRSFKPYFKNQRRCCKNFSNWRSSSIHLQME